MSSQVRPSFKEIKLSKATLGRNNHIGKDACRTVLALNAVICSVVFAVLKKLQ